MTIENIKINEGISKRQKVSRILRLMIPLIISIAVTVVLFYQEFDLKMWSTFDFTWIHISCIALAFLFICGRDIGIMWRFRLLCDSDKLSWRQAYHTNILCEFTSAITPSAIGGSGFVILFLKTEKIPVAKGTIVMLLTLFLDELCFVIVCPLFLMLFSKEELFGISLSNTGLYLSFLIIYLLILVWTIILYIILFRQSHTIDRIIYYLFHLPFLKRWIIKIDEFKDKLQLCSNEIRSYSTSLWLKVCIATLITWSSRFLVVCALFIPFISYKMQPLVFARQFILWIVMTVSPTPGGSGVSEYIFSAYYADFIDSIGVILLITCFWRIITFYLYLFLGICIFPTWIQNKFHSKSSI